MQTGTIIGMLGLELLLASQAAVIILLCFCHFPYVGMRNSLPPPNSTSSTGISLVELVEPVGLYHLIW